MVHPSIALRPYMDRREGQHDIRYTYIQMTLISYLNLSHFDYISGFYGNQLQNASLDDVLAIEANLIFRYHACTFYLSTI